MTMNWRSTWAAFGAVAFVLWAAVSAQSQVEYEEPTGYEGPGLTEAQTAIFDRYLPKALAKFQHRQPVHVVVLGDSIANMLGHDKEDAYNWLKSFHGVFTNELCRQFFYPGGVRLIKQRTGKPRKLEETIGAEVTLRNMARNGSTSLHIFQRLTTDAFYNKPDLIIINFGINDSIAGVPLGTYRESLSRAVDYAVSKGAEVILMGPAVIIAEEDPLRAMSMTRPYSSVMKEVAEEKNVFFTDLGDISSLVGGMPPRTTPEQVPKSIETSMKEHFTHDPAIVDYIHPNTNGHRLIGKHAYRRLVDPRDDDYAITAATAAVEGDELQLTLKLENRADEERVVTVVPMPLSKAYRTEEPAREVTLGAQGSAEIVLNYTSEADPESKAGFRDDFLPGFEEFVRGSVICADEQRTHFADFKATITPVAFNWKFGAQYNLAGRFPVGGELVNNGKEPLTATVTAEWAGQKGEGKAIVPPGGRHSLTFEFQFPRDPGRFREFSEILITVTSGGQTHRFRRGIEVSRNLGLGDSVPLAEVSAQPGGGQPVSADTRSAEFRAEADANALYLIFEMRGIDIVTTPEAPNGVVSTIALDARSYGVRQQAGFVEPMLITNGSADGPGTCGKLAVATFGEGYALDIDSKNVTSSLQTLPGGVRRLTVGIPRNYLYLHEFAIGNGNSQIGVGATLLVRSSDGSPGAGTAVQYSLLANGIHRCDARSLAVLELAKPATKRWSVRVF